MDTGWPLAAGMTEVGCSGQADGLPPLAEFRRRTPSRPSSRRPEASREPLIAGKWDAVGHSAEAGAFGVQPERRMDTGWPSASGMTEVWGVRDSRMAFRLWRSSGAARPRASSSRRPEASREPLVAGKWNAVGQTAEAGVFGV